MFIASIKVNKNDLFALLSQESAQAIFTHDGVFYTLAGVEREDGSGKSFNLTARRNSDGALCRFYART